MGSRKKPCFLRLQSQARSLKRSKLNVQCTSFHKHALCSLPFSSSDSTDLSVLSNNANLRPLLRFGERVIHSAIQLEVDERITLRFEKKRLIGKIILNRQVHAEHVKFVTLAKWKCREDHVVSELGRNKFMFYFQDEEDWKDVIINAPWTVGRGLLVLSPWTSGEIPEDLRFSFSPFWVQVHGLPIDYMKKENGPKIGKIIGEFVRVDGVVFDEKTVWKKYLRIRAVIDARNPLVPGFWLKRRTPLRDLWIEFKYEKLDLFCFKCGRIGTTYEFCKFPASVAKFGPWMRADSWKDLRDAATPSQAGAAVIDERGERDGNACTALVAIPQAKIMLIHSSKPETDDYKVQSSQVSTEDLPLRVILPRLILNWIDSLIMITICAMIYSRVACAYAYDSNWKFLVLMGTYLLYLVMKLIRIITRRLSTFRSSNSPGTARDHTFMAIMDILLLFLFLVMFKSC